MRPTRGPIDVAATAGFVAAGCGSDRPPPDLGDVSTFERFATDLAPIVEGPTRTLRVEGKTIPLFLVGDAGWGAPRASRLQARLQNALTYLPVVGRFLRDRKKRLGPPGAQRPMDYLPHPTLVASARAMRRYRRVLHKQGKANPRDVVVLAAGDLVYNNGIPDTTPRSVGKWQRVMAFVTCGGGDNSLEKREVYCPTPTECANFIEPLGSQEACKGDIGSKDEAGL